MEFKGILRHRQLVIGGIIGQEQTRAYFARNAHVHLPDVTALCSATGPFLRLHPVQHGDVVAKKPMDMSLSEIIDELFMRLAASSRWAWKVSNGRCPDCELKINRVIKDIIGSTMDCRG